VNKPANAPVQKTVINAAKAAYEAWRAASQHPLLEWERLNKRTQSVWLAVAAAAIAAASKTVKS
jgi:hypothetical protein